jgi:hypothetical protein
MREIVASRTSEGDSILSMKSGVLIATVVVANMVINIVARLSSKRDKREKEK